VWADSEHSFSAGWASQWGVDVSTLRVIQTEYAEQCIDVADYLLRDGCCDLLIIDSVAALTPKVEIEASAEKQQMGDFGKLMSKACRKWTSSLNSPGLLAENKSSVVLINQLRMNIGGYGATLVEPGGKAAPFYSSLRVRFKKTDFVKEDGTDRRIGINLQFEVMKNKTAPISEGGTFKMFFVNRPGFEVGTTDHETQVMRSAAFWQLIEKTGSWITFPDGTKVQGMDSAGEVLKEKPDLCKSLIASICANEYAWAEGVSEDESTEIETGGREEATA
jgi:recombination protein RecA